MKRRIALLRHLSLINEAAGALTELLEASPTDIEAWTELSELYQSQGLFSQAEFCLEEVILVAPNAWNVSSSYMDHWVQKTLKRSNFFGRYMLALVKFYINRQ